ncbi:glucose-6-phosphate isomerase [Treponema phagedenis]|uniref:glucose-6-phosphate isomerase n=1 Tax=Treponema phagedenis TaxID=162 RepID=UPI0001F63D60|nr:glucose-6-phosphate isomerase [Treponema phagedenis]EFW38494.1 glucose-6-phosphate isomerase [Treponema phagedenis F0421]TYT79057.1 glucose-6-phosphate isomerase [Treponema phagedenis]
MKWNNFDTVQAYKELQAAAKVCVKKALSEAGAAKRIQSFTVPFAGFEYNYAAKQVDADILALLQKLADEQDVIGKFTALLNGEAVNTGENRKVLHHLARGQLGSDVLFNGKNMRSFYLGELEKMRRFADDVQSGKILSSTGKAFTDVVQIGIGGSDLGPRAMYLALEGWAKKHGKRTLKAHFISNVDPDDAAVVLSELNLETTLCILVSKSGTTLETLTNELFVKKFLQDAGLKPEKHMAVVTSETSPLANNPDYLASFYIDDFIGGRYSSTSACGGLILSLALGFKTFEAFLAGAAAADKAATEKDITKNAALLDALIGVYERNVLGYETTAVLPYSQALARFPAHLQQLDMESNGKSVNRFGEPVAYKTGPIIFGEPGTNGQHSFYQHLHQGKTIVPLQFIAFENNQTGKDIEVDGSSSQKKLLANVVAQIIAFACGKEDSNPNKVFEGERPSSLLYAKELTPETLGALLAHFENKVMFQGFIWNINSFDQEGVQLGKVLAKKVLANDMPESLKAYSDLLHIL